MSEANDWGDSVGDWMFDKPRAKMLCNDSRTIRLLCLAISIPWFTVTVSAVISALLAHLMYGLVKIPYRGFMKIWAGPVCEENEDAGS